MVYADREHSASLSYLTGFDVAITTNVAGADLFLASPLLHTAEVALAS